MATRKCSLHGLVIKPDGANELDPCVYREVQRLRNVTVNICRCKYCGTLDVSWTAQENTEDITPEPKPAE